MLIDILRATVRNKLALFGTVILLGYLLMATVGPVVAPLDPVTRWAYRFQPPSWQHPLGTDHLGKDTLAQIIHGSRDVLSIAALAALFSILIAISVGAVSGYVGGKVDAGLNGAINVFLTIPPLPVMLIAAAVFHVTDVVSFALLLAVWMWPALARAVRAQILSLKEREFTEASRCLGLGAFHIVFRELVPNLMPYITIEFVRLVREAVTASVGIMLLGLAPFSPTNWGVMLNMAIFRTGAVFVPEATIYVLSPIAAIVFLQLGSLCFARGLEEVLNPRLREYE